MGFETETKTHPTDRPHKPIKRHPKKVSIWSKPPRFGDMIIDHVGEHGLIVAVNGETIRVHMGSGLTVDRPLKECRPRRSPLDRVYGNFAGAMKTNASEIG